MTRLDDADPTGTGNPLQSFVGAIPFGFTLDEDGVHMAGDATISDALRGGSGLPRPSVLATIADCIAGIPACLVTRPRLAVTLDIAVRMVATGGGDHLLVAGEIIKQGRSTVASEVRFTDAATTELVGISYLTFMASPRPQDQVPQIARGMRTTGPMPIPFPEYVGTRVVAPGRVEVDLTPFVMQASRSLQGGVVALIGELAAESLTGSPALDLDVRYLTAVRVGPGRATATAVGRGQVRVEVRDGGNEDRLAALIFVRVDPAA
jgi:acyl-coenzyme A thioesterase PaaI-like protein